jgi:D-threo-aldose 1-dehydrogenase
VSGEEPRAGASPPGRSGQPLPQVPLGRSGVRVTRLVFGGAPLGGLFTPVSDADAAATLEAAWAAGIRAFDTAPHYGVGLSEQRFGSFLRGQPRSDYVLSTKVGRRLVPATGDVEGVEGFYETPPFSRVRDYSRDGVLATLTASLERLGTDRADIVLIHDPDDHLPEAADSAFPALAELRAQGVIGAVGAGMNYPAPLEWLIERTELDCVLVAGRYSLLDASAAQSLFPTCQRRGVAVLAGGVFNSGVLARPAPGATYDYAPVPPVLLDRAQRIAAVCERHQVPLGAAAMDFVLRHPAVTAALAGARSPAEITQDAGFLTTAVPDALYQELAAEGLLPTPDAQR